MSVGLLPPAPPEPPVVRLIGSAVDWSIVLIGTMMVGLVFANVVLHLFALDLAWVIELSELLLVWVTFLGAAAATRRGGHMAISELVDLFGGRARRILRVAIAVAVCGVLCMLLVYGGRLVSASWGSVLTVLDWPMAVQYLALPVGAALTLVFAGWDVVQAWRGPVTGA
ncbi:MAG: TRAP transporter small permease [Burkholderiales bacterium]|nr:MAG: TRAP transporter small permease [Burkholderiales bacterium]